MEHALNTTAKKLRISLKWRLDNQAKVRVHCPIGGGKGQSEDPLYYGGGGGGGRAKVRGDPLYNPLYYHFWLE